MSAREHWVMTFNPHDGCIKVHGPFDNEAAAAGYGRRWQQANDDNPCWNTLAGTPRLLFVKPEGAQA